MLAAGNANDHRRSVATMSVVDAIVAGPIRRMDLLKLVVCDGIRPPWERYVHSYVGFGLSASMARGIETSGKGRLRELMGVARTLPGLRSFQIERPAGARARFDSLILANVHRMAKYGTVSDSKIPSDGKFEVVYLPHSTRWVLARMTLRAVTVGLGRQTSVAATNSALNCHCRVNSTVRSLMFLPVPLSWWKAFSVSCKRLVEAPVKECVMRRSARGTVRRWPLASVSATRPTASRPRKIGGQCTHRTNGTADEGLAPRL